MGTAASYCTLAQQCLTHCIFRSKSLPLTCWLQCTGAGDLGLSCLFYDLVLWQQQFYYITTGERLVCLVPVTVSSAILFGGITGFKLCQIAILPLL